MRPRQLRFANIVSRIPVIDNPPYGGRDSQTPSEYMLLSLPFHVRGRSYERRIRLAYELYPVALVPFSNFGETGGSFTCHHPTNHRSGDAAKHENLRAVLPQNMVARFIVPITSNRIIDSFPFLCFDLLNQADSDTTEPFLGPSDHSFSSNDTCI